MRRVSFAGCCISKPVCELVPWLAAMRLYVPPRRTYCRTRCTRHCLQVALRRFTRSHEGRALRDIPGQQGIGV
eukprot:687561-Alexandrium_andersonii.AAC.1